jgi:hypothetical protein
MADIRNATVRYGTSLPGSGLFPGELFVTYVNGTDIAIYIWNDNDGAWEALGGDGAALSGTTLTLGSTTISETEAAFIDGVTAGASAASKGLVLDSNSELDGLGTLQKEDTLIANAAVLTLNATPVSILTAPGAGVYRIPERVLVFMDYGAAAFVAGAGEDITIQKPSGGEVTFQTIDGTVFTATADVLAEALPLNADASTVADRAANSGLEITIASGEWATGDSALKVRVLYRDYRAASLEAIS